MNSLIPVAVIALVLYGLHRWRGAEMWILLVAVVLIVYGRVNRRPRWGNLIAVAGYTVLGVAIVVGLAARG